MAGVTLRHIYKVYAGGVTAVNDFNLVIKDKEFIVFVEVKTRRIDKNNIKRHIDSLFESGCCKANFTVTSFGILFNYATHLKG